MAATTTKWIPPLPPGFEARFDPTTRRYFFIHHSTKTTTWEDPRFSNANQAAQLLGQGSENSRRGETVELSKFGAPPPLPKQKTESETTLSQVDSDKLKRIRHFYPTCSEQEARQALLSCTNFSLAVEKITAAGHQRRTSPSPSPQRSPGITANEKVAKKIQNSYPHVDITLIRDILESCHNSEVGARIRLDKMGYRAQETTAASTHSHVHDGVSEMGHRSRNQTPTRDPGVSNRHDLLGTSDNNHKKQPSPKRTPTRAAEPELSQFMKDQMAKKLCAAYPHVTETMVAVALQVCDYNEERAKTIIVNTMSDERSQESSSSRGQSGITSPGSEITTKFTSSLEVHLHPASFVDPTDDFVMPSIKKAKNASSKETQRPSTSSSTVSPKRSATSSPASGSRNAKPAVKPAAKAKNVIRLSEQLLDITNTMLSQLVNTCCSSEDPTFTDDSGTPKPHATSAPVISQRGVYVSSNRLTPSGPNKALNVGPNNNLLICDYVKAHGPNPVNRSGANKSNVRGPQGALGPNASYQCGPKVMTRGSSLSNLPGRQLIVSEV